MKKTLALLAATTALTATFGLPVLGGMFAPPQADQGATAAIFAPEDAFRLVLIDSDDDDDEEDADDEDEEEDCDEDDDDECSAGRNPAPAGSVAPPANGLFGNGAPPKVQVN